jgi:hypothetical protein
VPQVASIQADRAGPASRNFLVPILAPAGAKAELGRLRACLTGTDDAPRAKQFAELFRRMTVPGTGPYPTAETIFEMSACLRAWRGHDWAWSPVLLYASGHLPTLVKTIATVDVRCISSSQLANLIEALPGAIAGDVVARKRWVLAGTARRAFRDLAEVEKRFQRPFGHLSIAHVLANSFDALDYEPQRRMVLEYLAKSIAERMLS